MPLVQSLRLLAALGSLAALTQAAAPDDPVRRPRPGNLTGAAMRLLPAAAAPALAASGSQAAAQAAWSGFDQAADKALAAMRKRAGELGIGGVAVVAWFEGEGIRSWTSKMVVVGRYKDEPTANSKGSNLLAIAYSKASEMADTLKNSGSGARPPMTGEVGWTGGAIARRKAGYWIAALQG